MSTLLKDWAPSDAAIELIKLNGVDDKRIANAVDYLKNKSGLIDITDVEGYDNWNSFFIMFCLKLGKAADA